MSATFWIRRKKRAAELAKQQTPVEAVQVPEKEKRATKKGVKKDDK